MQDRKENSSNESLSPKPRQNGGYIVSPFFDHLFFIWSPILCLVIGAVLSWTGLGSLSITLDLPFGAVGEQAGDVRQPGVIYIFPALVITFSMAHVFAVFFRSHLNPSIFKLYPVRFIVVPLALIALFAVSETAWIIGLFLIVCADNYHSSLQTFGLGRLYDMRAGNSPDVGRNLDFWLALVIFIGPILSGVTLVDALARLERFDEISLHQIAMFPGWAVANQLWISAPVLILGGSYIAFYLFAYWKLWKRGYRVSPQKVMLYATLAMTSLISWGFGGFGQAFLIMESFHSFQYFGIVWWSEQKNLQQRLRVSSRRGGKGLVLALFLGVSFSFGLWVAVFEHTRFELVLFGVCELMHYWYDGFIWSVRKKQVS